MQRKQSSRRTGHWKTRGTGTSEGSPWTWSLTLMKPGAQVCTGVRDGLPQHQDTDLSHPHLSALSTSPPCCGLSWPTCPSSSHTGS